SCTDSLRPENRSLLIRPEWQSKLDKMVVLHPVTFRDKQENNLHRILRAVDHNILLSKQTRAQIADPSETFLLPESKRHQ
ncbi:MAG: hypothetical protein EOO38_31000, partial [Cytophagaceae bacterium]